MMTKMKSCLLAAALGLSFSTFAAAQDFVVGVSGAITGPTASTYAPTVESMRIYFDRDQQDGRHQRHEGEVHRTRRSGRAVARRDQCAPSGHAGKS